MSACHGAGAPPGGRRVKRQPFLVRGVARVRHLPAGAPFRSHYGPEEGSLIVRKHLLDVIANGLVGIRPPGI